jgi:hypothetical protein
MRPRRHRDAPSFHACASPGAPPGVSSTSASQRPCPAALPGSAGRTVRRSMVGPLRQ